MSEQEIRPPHPELLVNQDLHGEKANGKRPAPDQSGVIAAKRRPPSLVVGIGASAGGLDAFKSFFDGVPGDTGMTFVLVQHLDPDHKSMLVELLRPHTSMRVEEARDRVALAANHVFVIPPNATMTMEGDLLRVSTPRRRESTGGRSIRFSLRSLKIRRIVPSPSFCLASAAMAPWALRRSRNMADTRSLKRSLMRRR